VPLRTDIAATPELASQQARAMTGVPGKEKFYPMSGGDVLMIEAVLRFALAVRGKIQGDA